MSRPPPLPPPLPTPLPLAAPSFPPSPSLSPPSPPWIDYRTPGPTLTLRLDVAPDGLTLYDRPPPLWRLITAPIVALFLGFLTLGIASLGGAGWIVALIPGSVTLMNVLVFLDDLAQRIRPGIVEVRGGMFRWRQLRCLGPVNRQRSVSDVRDIRVARNSPTVHAFDDVLVRFHRGRSASILHCRDVPEAEHWASVLREACGPGTPYLPPGQ